MNEGLGHVMLEEKPGEDVLLYSIIGLIRINVVWFVYLKGSCGLLGRKYRFKYNATYITINLRVPPPCVVLADPQESTDR